MYPFSGYSHLLRPIQPVPFRTVTLDAAMTPLLILEEFLNAWPKRSETFNEQAFAKKFAARLTDNFDFSNLANRPFERLVVGSSALLLGRTAKFLVYDTKFPDYPNLAVLQEGADGQWRLQAFLFECVNCFGTGVLAPAELCGTCGATGWGLADYVNGKTAFE